MGVGGRTRPAAVLGSITLVAAVFFVTASAHAATVTDVVDAFDVAVDASQSGAAAGPNADDNGRADPFDIHVSTRFDASWTSAAIAREPNAVGDGTDCTTNNPRGCAPSRELSFARQQLTQSVQVDVGLFRDLGLRLTLPIVLQDRRKFDYARGVTAATSSVDPQDGQSLFAHDLKTTHAGVGGMRVGLRYAPLNDARDRHLPTWLLTAEWTMPWTSQVNDPSADGQTGTLPVGDGMHWLTFGTALSKRLITGGFLGHNPRWGRRGYVDPYVKLSYSLPIPDRSVALDDFKRSDDNPFGRAPSHVVRFSMGAEVVPWEVVRDSMKVAIDAGFDGAYHTQGRNYSALSDALGEPTFTDEFTQLGGRLGVTAQLGPYVQIRTGVTVASRSDHFLTNESAGDDRDGDGQVLSKPSRPGEAVVDKVNPYFCGKSGNDVCSEKGTSVDQVGFRFRNEDHLVVQFFTQLAVTF